MNQGLQITNYQDNNGEVSFTVQSPESNTALRKALQDRRVPFDQWLAKAEQRAGVRIGSIQSYKEKRGGKGKIDVSFDLSSIVKNKRENVVNFIKDHLLRANEDIYKEPYDHRGKGCNIEWLPDNIDKLGYFEFEITVYGSLDWYDLRGILFINMNPQENWLKKLNIETEDYPQETKKINDGFMHNNDGFMHNKVSFHIPNINHEERERIQEIIMEYIKNEEKNRIEVKENSPHAITSTFTDAIPSSKK